MKIFLVSSFVIFSLAVFSTADDKRDKPPIELGQVNWHKDLDSAMKLAKKKKLPLFVQFQEVPG